MLFQVLCGFELIFYTTHPNEEPKNLTEDEINSFHLSTLKLSYEDAVKEYEYRANTRLGKLIANRELPVLQRAKEIIDETIG